MTFAARIAALERKLPQQEDSANRELRDALWAWIMCGDLALEELAARYEQTQPSGPLAQVVANLCWGCSEAPKSDGRVTTARCEGGAGR